MLDSSETRLNHKQPCALFLSLLTISVIFTSFDKGIFVQSPENVKETLKAPIDASYNKKSTGLRSGANKESRIKKGDSGPHEQEIESLEEIDLHDEQLQPSTSKKEQNKIAWLLSFPNSGTSYTITNTEQMSNMTTASNYAMNWNYTVPVRPDLINGPFVHKLERQLPPFVLTKTHCDGYCWDCAPRDFVQPLRAFEQGCRTARSKVVGQSVSTIYDSNVPSRAVHLIRNPFDNLVSRLHFGIAHHRRNWTKEQEATFVSSKAGLDAWCAYVDNKFAKRIEHTKLIDEDVKALMKDVPCHSEWYRYVQWHNHALQITERLKLPVHYLYYEGYSRDFNRTVGELFEFLELPVVNDRKPFVSGKTYVDEFFTSDEARAAARLVRALATTDCWELIHHYVDPWINSENGDV